MNHPAWLVQLHRQWMTARGKSVTSKVRPFPRNWDDLLDSAGIHSAEDRQTALREARKEETRQHLKLYSIRGRPHLIQKIELPIEAESWLLRMFDQKSSAQNLDASLQVLQEAKSMAHQRFPVLWQKWCLSVEEKFLSGKNARPLYWSSPDNVKAMLALIYQLTSNEYEPGILIREVSVSLGLSSKDLERQRLGVEACLSQMFERPMPLQALGIVLTDSRTSIAGILTLHYVDGSEQKITELKAIYSLSLDDLNRAHSVSTPATRLLTVENSKTTLRRLAMSNLDGTTLLAACAYPTEALQRLMALLPNDMPMYHFGDTDAAGFQILAKLRESTPRIVHPFLMHRRIALDSHPLSEYDLSILPRLLEEPTLKDVTEEIQSIWASQCKGNFEQETYGLPDLKCWPFYSFAEQ